eukprot:TRINITY_DN5924_c0_g1_i2.p1 TRINITY_DN5924_c0_g1~~TRINITY_DN5924_c0_g1_i2.p1  ORF type:complete len:347 (+),score=42.38 TRINITY_DN5924_c0_g1_i2:28-1068(+)
MGCGASTGGKGVRVSERYAAQTDKDRDNEDPDGKGFKKKKRDSLNSYEKSDCDWHEAHCKHGHFVLCESIQDAYAFDDADKNTFVKNQIVGSGDWAKRQNWGEVKYSKLQPKRLFCDLCGNQIAERGKPAHFYCCSNCRSNKRKLELCQRCYDAGALSTPGAAEAILKHEQKNRDAGRKSQRGRKSGTGSEPLTQGAFRPSVASAASDDSTEYSGERTGSKASRRSVNSKDRVNSKEPRPFVTKRPALPSGTWSVTFVEGKSRRTEQRELNFMPSGTVTGTGWECSVQGYYGNGKAGDDADIVETYAWGTISMSAKIIRSGDNVTLQGTFVASDDGKGTVELRLQL